LNLQIVAVVNIRAGFNAMNRNKTAHFSSLSTLSSAFCRTASSFAPAGPAGFWTTLHPYAGNDDGYSGRECMVMGVIARLQDGATVQQALADVRECGAAERANILTRTEIEAPISPL
jgi:hypothetical protein